MNLKDIDPELKYCPKCGDEYRAEIQACAGCTVPLVLGRVLLAAVESSNAPVESRPLIIGPDEAVVSIRKGPMLQIKELQQYLKKRGVAAQIFKDDGAGCGCRGPEVILQVREQELQQVMAVLAEEYCQTTGLADHDTQFAGSVFDDQAEDALCPACGHRFSTQENTCPDCGLCFG
ncbi:MAG: hypothetical protein PHI97_04810 [Desulfobulbus sp.]|nr:hypothetical protein [Desulfobulbus sp.]